MSETATITKKSTAVHSRLSAAIPMWLIRETIDGIPFYYAGYRSVLNKTKTLEDIMADSGLQLILKRFFFKLLDSYLDSATCWVLMGEVGSHLDHRNNMGLDVAVYEKKQLTPDKITSQYIDVTPKIVIEVDVRVEMKDKDANLFEEFVLRKVKKLFAFGTEKIVWVFSKSKTVIIATPDNKWSVLDWDQDIELSEGLIFNIGKYLETEGIQPAG
jgi:hypothetical protein